MKRAVGTINRKSRLAAKLAFIFIQSALITNAHPPHQPALRAKSWRRYFYLLVKIKIVRLNDEALLTVLTNFCFLWHKTFYRKVLQDMNDRLDNATLDLQN